jgi:hypothetical protein
MVALWFVVKQLGGFDQVLRRLVSISTPCTRRCLRLEQVVLQQRPLAAPKSSIPLADAKAMNVREDGAQCRAGGLEDWDER